MATESFRAKNILKKMSYDEARRIFRQFRVLLALSIVAIAIGTVFMHYTEDLSWVDAAYFSVVSLTTVGYGDITPQTTPGKIFTMFYLIVGIGIIAALVSNIIKGTRARHIVKHHDPKSTKGKK